MKVASGFIMMIFCLTGCSELGVIGNAAMRELRADAISVNWNKKEADYVEKREILTHSKRASAKGKSFSSFRSRPADKTKPVKGLWEQASGHQGGQPRLLVSWNP